MNTKKLSASRTAASAILIAAAAGFLSSSALADTWRVNPKMSANIGYVDSVRLADDSDSAIVLAGYGKVEFGRYAERNSLVLDVGLNFNRYETDDTSLNEDERPFAGLKFNYAISERAEATLNAGYFEDLINGDANSTFDQEELNTDTDTGFSGEQLKRGTIKFEPSVGYRVSERIGVEASYYYKERSYDRNGGISDSDDHDFRLGGSYSFNDRYTLVSELKNIRFETNLDQKVTGNTFTFGLRHKYSEVAQITYNVGWNEMDFESNLGDTSDSVFTANVRWNLRQEKANFSALLERAQYPSASGGFVLTDLLSVAGNWRLSEKFSAEVSARYFQNESVISGLENNDDRDYLTLAPTLSYLLNEKWKIDLRYRYSKQTRDGVSAVAGVPAMGGMPAILPVAGVPGTSFDQSQITIGISYTPLREF